MVIQIAFDNPLYISSQSKSLYDLLRVENKHDTLLVSKTSLKPIELNSSIEGVIPP